MLAGFTNTPELVMSEDEAKLIVSATEKVARHYSSGVLPQKAVDWTNLISALGAVYGPRFMAAKIRTASDKAKVVNPARQPAPNPGPAPVRPTPRPSDAATTEQKEAQDILQRLHQAG